MKTGAESLNLGMVIPVRLLRTGKPIEQEEIIVNNTEETVLMLNRFTLKMCNPVVAFTN